MTYRFDAESQIIKMTAASFFARCLIVNDAQLDHVNLCERVNNAFGLNIVFALMGFNRLTYSRSTEIFLAPQK